MCCRLWRHEGFFLPITCNMLICCKSIWFCFMFPATIFVRKNVSQQKNRLYIYMWHTETVSSDCRKTCFCCNRIKKSPRGPQSFTVKNHYVDIWSVNSENKWIQHGFSAEKVRFHESKILVKGSNFYIMGSTIILKIWTFYGS